MTSVAEPLMGAVSQLASQLKPGRVYRREDLACLSTAVDRHLRVLVARGKLKKLAQGLYYVPKQSIFGPLPPADDRVAGRSRCSLTLTSQIRYFRSIGRLKATT